MADLRDDESSSNSGDDDFEEAYAPSGGLGNESGLLVNSTISRDGTSSDKLKQQNLLSQLNVQLSGRGKPFLTFNDYHIIDNSLIVVFRPTKVNQYSWVCDACDNPSRSSRVDGGWFWFTTCITSSHHGTVAAHGRTPYYGSF